MGPAAARPVKRFSLAALALAIVASAAGAQQNPSAPPADPANDPHAVQPERPTVATHAGTVAPGWLEIETGVERDRFASKNIGYVTPTVLKFGIADHMQLGVFGSVAHPAPGTTGLGDVAVGVKWRLLDNAPLVGDFAVLPAVKFPTGSSASGTGTGTTDASVLLISSHDLGGVSMDINAGYTHRGGDGSTVPASATLWTISAGGSLAGRLGWTAELYGYPGTGGPAGQAPVVALLGGPTLLLRPWLAFDAGVILPVTGPQPRALYAGAVYNVGRLWSSRE